MGWPISPPSDGIVVGIGFDGAFVPSGPGTTGTPEGPVEGNWLPGCVGAALGAELGVWLGDGFAGCVDGAVEGLGSASSPDDPSTAMAPPTTPISTSRTITRPTISGQRFFFGGSWRGGMVPAGNAQRGGESVSSNDGGFAPGSDGGPAGKTFVGATPPDGG